MANCKYIYIYLKINNIYCIHTVSGRYYIKRSVLRRQSGDTNRNIKRSVYEDMDFISFTVGYEDMDFIFD